MNGDLLILFLVLTFSCLCCLCQTAGEVQDEKALDEIFNAGKDVPAKQIPVNEEVDEGSNKDDTVRRITLVEEDKVKTAVDGNIVFKEDIEEKSQKESEKVEVKTAEEEKVVTKIEEGKNIEEAAKLVPFKALQGYIEVPIVYKLLIKVEKSKEALKPVGEDPDIDIRSLEEKEGSEPQGLPWSFPKDGYGPGWIRAGQKFPLSFQYRYHLSPFAFPKPSAQFVYLNHHHFGRPFSLLANKLGFYNALAS